MKGLNYYIKKSYQFSQSKPVYDKLSGRVITYIQFPFTFLHFIFKYGPGRLKIVKRERKRVDRIRKFAGLDRFVKGLILCHSASNIVPPGKYYKRVFVYHGTGDKAFTGIAKNISADWFEYYFITGDKDLYKFKKFFQKPELLDDRIVRIGMFSSDPIVNNSYDKEKILEKFGIKPEGKKIVLYAPTWKWGGGSLGKCFEIFAREIPKKYILIIRPHFNDRKNINYIFKWLRKHRVKDIYFFPKPYQDIINFIYVSDLLIGDNSSVNYDFAFTKRPVVIVDSPHEDVFNPPDEFNIRLCGPLYNPEKDDILEKIDEAFSSPMYKNRMEELINKSFYFNDGHAVDRACSFIVDTLSEMGIIDLEKTLKQYEGKFTYKNNYR